MDAKDLFEYYGWLDGNGNYTVEGLKALSLLIDKLPRIHEGMWRDVFIPYMSKAVNVSAEIAIIREDVASGKRQILLTMRDDQYYGKGWHIPGGFIGPGETRQETVERIAGREIRIKPTFRQIIKPFFHDDDPRFPHVAIVFECSYDGQEEVSAGKWFDSMPDNIIKAHEKYRVAVGELLRR